MKLKKTGLFIGVIIALFITACGKKGEETYVEPTAKEKLQTKLVKYEELYKTQQDAFGFIFTDKCDSLLFSSLAATNAKVSFDVTSAELNPGQWLRRPKAYSECFAAGESKSTISRDMLLGLYWYIWSHKRLDLALDLYKYATAHNLVMGQGDPAATVLSPIMLATLAQLIHSMGGPDYAVRYTTTVWTATEGYQAHLQALHILLRFELYGTVNQNALNVLKVYRNNNPENPLFQYAISRLTDNDQTKAVDLLLKETYFPNDRLPTNEQYCTDWLFERDFGSDWKPCADEAQHSGGELVFLAGQILKK